MAAKKEKKTSRTTTKTKAPVKKRTLSREAILRDALAIVDKDGFEGLTIRKLAMRLNVTSTAVYRHFQNKSDITDQLVDLVVGDYDVTNHHEEQWQDWICSTFFLMYKALCEHPGIIPTLNNFTGMGDNAMGVMEQILQAFRSAGFEGKDSVRYFHMLMSYTIGNTILTNHDRNEDSKAPTNKQLTKFETAPQLHYPNIVRLAPHIVSVANNQHFRQGLQQILASLEHK